MESNPCEKRLNNECIDRISNLPDPILGKIISHLPIKEVIATSILSTRWKNIIFPTHVPLNELVLDDSDVLDSDDPDTSSYHFIDFMDKLLYETLSDVPCVEKVVINCDNHYDDPHRGIYSWVHGALELNVQHLRVMSKRTDVNKLFYSLNGCETLVELEIGGDDSELLLPKGFRLPNLKRLALYSLLPCDDVDSIHALIAGCPVLNELKFRGLDFSLLDYLCIRHPLITKLCIEGSFREGGSKVEIDAPNLETFAYEGRDVANYVFKDVKSLHSVYIIFDIFGEDPYGERYRSKARRLAKLVKGCSSAAHLCLSGNSLTALYHSRVSLPTFQNVTCLALGHMGSHGLELLAKLLRNAPNLTTIIFQKELEFPSAYEDFMSMLPCLPVCLELHVKKIEIWVFEGRPHEIELIAYFLENGRVLQELIIPCLPCNNSGGVEKLFALPRYSKACQVLLRGKDKRGESRYARDNWF